MALFGRVAGGEAGGEPAKELANEVAIAFHASDDRLLQEHSDNKSFRACFARPHRHLQLVTLVVGEVGSNGAVSHGGSSKRVPRMLAISELPPDSQPPRRGRFGD